MNKVNDDDQIIKKIMNKLNCNCVKRIGKGGYGSVYHIKNKNGNYALKLIKINRLKEKNDPQRYQTTIEKIRYELESSINLKSKYIIKTVQTFEYKKDSDDQDLKDFPEHIVCFGIIMEKAAYNDLNFLIHLYKKKILFNSRMNNHPLFSTMSDFTIKFFINQIILGLDFLNRSFLIHADIKPENILLNYGFTTKITDLSTLTAIKKNSDLILPSGTFCFQGPEYYEEQKKIDSKDSEKIDIFALGIIIYYMKYFIYPMNQNNKAKLNKNQVIGILNKEIENISNDSNISPELKELMIKMIEPDISKRATIEDILGNKWLNEEKKFIDKIHRLNDGEDVKLFIEFQKYDKKFYEKKKKGRKYQL